MHIPLFLNFLKYALSNKIPLNTRLIKLTFLKSRVLRTVSQNEKILGSPLEAYSLAALLVFGPLGCALNFQNFFICPERGGVYPIVRDRKSFGIFVALRSECGYLLKGRRKRCGRFCPLSECGWVGYL